MQIKDYIMVLIVTGLLAWCIGGAVYLLNSQYNTDAVNISVIDSMGGDINPLISNVNSSYKIVSTTGAFSAGGAFGVLFNSIGNFFLVLFNVVTMPFRWVVLIGNSFGIPSTITAVIIALILAGITFAIVSSILRRTP